MFGIKHFCSLGTLCHPTRMMQRLHIKPVSYPFDWIFCDEDIIVDVLEDDFNKFMDKSYYLDLKNNFNDPSCGCGHSYYHEDFFFHKNPRNEEHYAYYQRCIDRFKKMLKVYDEKMFIMMYTPETTQHPKDVYQLFENGMSKEDIISNIKSRVIKLNETLRKHTSNFILLVIINFGDNTEQTFKMEHLENIHYLTLNTLSHSTGVTFRNNADNLFLSGIVCEHYFK